METAARSISKAFGVRALMNVSEGIQNCQERLSAVNSEYRRPARRDLWLNGYAEHGALAQMPLAAVSSARAE